MNVIDLDRPVAVLPARRRKSHLLAGFALVIGAVLGASGMYGWSARQQAGVRDRPVAVFVFAEAGPFPDDAPVGSVVLGGRLATVTLTRRMTVVNAGPVAIAIHDLAGSRSGVSVRGVARQRWIAPGATVQAEVDVQVDCAHGLPLGRLPVTLSVHTLDDGGREVRPPESLDGTPWSRQAEVACAGKA
jgi:hypothetical protein